MSGFGWHTTAEDVARGVDLSGRQIVLTGATSGIGRETARALALTGADLVLGVRDVVAGEALAAEIAQLGKGEVTVHRLDLGDLESVRDFAALIEGPVDILINNAGVSNTPDTHFPNGLDVRFATNHLGHFYLNILIKHNLSARGARVVVLSSAAHKGCPIHLDDLQWRKRPHIKGMAYAESKSANILFSQELSRRWASQGITANAVLPGSALTGLQRFHGEELKRKIGFIHADGSIDPMVKTAEQAAATTVWAATAPELDGRGGLVLEDCAVALPVGPDTHPWSGYDASVSDLATARALWEESERLIRALCGVDLSSR
jgi:NAD(P)-dependent dehydrogenase (short-subunit alcohol dehydrogenase family)